MSEKRYVFTVEWFDTQASVIRKFYFTYYLPDHLIEMVLFPISFSTISKTKRSS